MTDPTTAGDAGASVRVPGTEGEAPGVTFSVRTGRLVVGTVVVLFSAAFLVGGLALGMGTLTAIGSGAFPVAAASLGMLAGGLAVVEAVMHRGDSRLQVELPSGPAAVRMLVFVLALAFFALFVEMLGFLLAAFVTCSITSMVSGQHRAVRAVAFAALFALAVFLVFTQLLEVRLPQLPFLNS